MTPVPSILIAEDDRFLREAYIRRFARTAYDVRTARNGEEAAALIHAHAPDLLICDIMMPDQDGWWVLEQFPKGERSFPVIMLTNFADAETRKRCESQGVEGYLVKHDMSLHTLVETVDRLLANRPR